MSRSDAASPPEKAPADVLLVFAKPPAPGRVKTRLTPVLTPGDAAALYDAFLRDALEQYASLDLGVRLYWAPPAPHGTTGWVPEHFTVRVQQGDGLGARMRNAVRETLDEGAERVALIGTDHPTLPSSFIEQAFVALREPGAISIGPSADGGYYLLGMNIYYPQLFEDMRYSHEEVFSETMARATRTGAEVTVLPRWYDVDTPAALRRCIRDLEATRTTAPRTRRTLAQIDLERLDIES